MFFRTLLCCLVLLCCATLPAQKTGDRVKNRAENRANNNVDRKVDRAVDDAFNAVGNLFKKKNKNKNKQGETAPVNAPAQDDAPAATNGNIMGAFGLGNDDFEPYTNEKSFSTVLETTEYKRNGKHQTTRMEIAMLPTQIALKINADGTDSRTLFDTQTGKTTVVSTDKKGKTEATRMRMPSFGGAAMEETIEETANGYTFEETGETRTIDGYPCRKIVATDTKNNLVTEGWVTDAAGISNYEVFSGIAAMFTGGNASAFRKKMPLPPFQGIMLEGTTTEASGKRTTMKMKNIRVGEGQVNHALFDLTGIPVQEINY